MNENSFSVFGIGHQRGEYTQRAAEPLGRENLGIDEFTWQRFLSLSELNAADTLAVAQILHRPAMVDHFSTDSHGYLFRNGIFGDRNPEEPIVDVVFLPQSGRACCLDEVAIIKQNQRLLVCSDLKGTGLTTQAHFDNWERHFSEDDGLISADEAKLMVEGLVDLTLAEIPTCYMGMPLLVQTRERGTVPVVKRGFTWGLRLSALVPSAGKTWLMNSVRPDSCTSNEVRQFVSDARKQVQMYLQYMDRVESVTHGMVVDKGIYSQMGDEKTIKNYVQAMIKSFAKIIANCMEKTIIFSKLNEQDWTIAGEFCDLSSYKTNTSIYTRQFDFKEIRKISYYANLSDETIINYLLARQVTETWSMLMGICAVLREPIPTLGEFFSLVQRYAVTSSQMGGSVELSFEDYCRLKFHLSSEQVFDCKAVACLDTLVAWMKFQEKTLSIGANE